MTPSSPPDGPLQQPRSTRVPNNGSNSSSSINSHASMTPELGCLHRTLCFTANTIHLVQFTIGVAALTYAIVISCHKPDPQHGFATLFEVYGVLLIIASSFGALGIYKPNCKRITLLISMRLASVLAVLNGLIAVALWTEKASFLRYITEKQHSLFLSDQLLDVITRHVKIIPMLLFVSGVVEVMRFYMLKKIKENLRLYDNEQRNEMLRSHARSVLAAQQQRQEAWHVDPRRNRARNEMQVPLLSDPFDSEGGPFNTSNISFHPNDSCGQSRVSWWEEPTDNDREESVDHSKDSGGSWISRVLRKTSKNHSFSAENGEDEELGDEASTLSVIFAPIDGTIDDVESTQWHDGIDMEDNKPPDLSWVHGESTDLES